MYDAESPFCGRNNRFHTGELNVTRALYQTSHFKSKIGLSFEEQLCWEMSVSDPHELYGLTCRPHPTTNS